MSSTMSNHETEAELASLRQRVAELEEQLARAATDSFHVLASGFDVQYLLDALVVPIFYKDASGRYAGCNAAFAAFLGRDRAQIIGRTAYDLAPPHLADVYHQADMNLMRQRTTQIYEAEVRAAQGELRYVRFSKAPLFDPSGNVIGLIGAIEDITERKKAEKETARLMEILENTPDVIGMANAQGQVVYMNKAGRRFMGLADDADLAGMQINDFHPAWAAKVISEQAIPLADRNGSQWILERRFCDSQYPRR